MSSLVGAFAIASCGVAVGTTLWCLVEWLLYRRRRPVGMSAALERERVARLPMRAARSPATARAILAARLHQWSEEELREKRGECIELLDAACREDA